MKLKVLFSALVAGGAMCALAATDPVLMTIDGKDVHLSEFEYLYKKNSAQQVEKESLSQYVDRFVNYKLKVADARHACVDTTAAFKAELESYKNDLVKPYLVDTTVVEKMARRAYDHMTKNVDVSHLMLPRGRDAEELERQVARMDSLRNCILAGESFTDLVEKYSIDPSKARNHGDYGFITAGLFPYEWENVAFETPVGQVSKPVVTDYGVHLIRVNGVRPDEGQVEVEHILVMFPRGKEVTDEQKQAVKNKIDSIYREIKAGANFEELARKHSDDGSKRNGGKLGWFGRGQMVKPFEEVSFKLPDGEISEPFETQFGYHIVKNLGHRATESYEKRRKAILASFERDGRAQQPYQERLKQLREQYKPVRNPQFEAHINQLLAKTGKYDSAFVAAVAADNFPAYTFDNKKGEVLLSQVAHSLYPKAKFNNNAVAGYVSGQLNHVLDKAITDYYVNDLINKNPDFRNLLNEYYEGSMLYEVSNKRVWEAASADTLGLKNYFEQHRDKYIWDEPRFKGVILMAKNDSILDEVKKVFPGIRKKAASSEDATEQLHNMFGDKINMERFNNFTQGQNRMVDHVAFGEANNGTTNPAYPVFMMLEGKLVETPETFNDVKGMVTSDYQDVLEKKWVDELHKKYRVVINDKVLKKVKEIK